MITFIALGNKGSKYKNTRHNVATLVVDSIVPETDWDENKYAYAHLANIKINEKEVIFVKPDTFMNESGRVIPYLLKNFSLNSDDIIVIHDDIDLPFGGVRISYDRGDGGHNGVKSIMENLNSKQFLRIRIGVSILDEEQILRKPDVLGNFNQDELEKIKKEIAPKISKIINTIIEEGQQKAMSLFN